METVADPSSGSSSVSEREFGFVLAAIVLAALAIRVSAAFWYDNKTVVQDDAFWYTGVAWNLAHGNGFVEPLHLVTGQRVPTAAHPPLYPLYLSVVDVAGSSSTLLHRLWSCLPGAGTVALLGLIGRDLAGRRAGLIAAALGAISIELLAQDVILWSEGLYGFTIALTVFTAYRYLRRPDLIHAGLLAAAITIAALTRAEAALLFVILLAPLVLRNRDQTWARRFGTLGVGALVALVLMGPWLVYNNAGRFEHPVGLSVSFGTLIGTSNCRYAFYGENIGGWGVLCSDTVPQPWPVDESVAERAARSAGLGYVSGHLDRVPLVVAARLGRSFGFYAPTKSISDTLLFQQAKVNRLAYLVLAQYWLYLGLAVAGGVALFRRRMPLFPLLAPVITVAAITVVGYGSTRFRIALDVVIPALAAVAIEGYLSRRAHGHHVARRLDEPALAPR